MFLHSRRTGWTSWRSNTSPISVSRPSRRARSARLRVRTPSTMLATDEAARRGTCVAPFRRTLWPSSAHEPRSTHKKNVDGHQRGHVVGNAEMSEDMHALGNTGFEASQGKSFHRVNEHFLMHLRNAWGVSTLSQQRRLPQRTYFWTAKQAPGPEGTRGTPCPAKMKRMAPSFKRLYFVCISVNMCLDACARAVCAAWCAQLYSSTKHAGNATDQHDLTPSAFNYSTAPLAACHM